MLNIKICNNTNYVYFVWLRGWYKYISYTILTYKNISYKRLIMSLFKQ